MKLNITPRTNRKSGMTLLELTVVILVLLSLIAILFIGARAWKKGSDRAASILVIRNVQQAVRSYANLNEVNAGSTVTNLKTEIFGEGKFMIVDPTTEKHPGGTGLSYSIAAATVVPIIGKLYMEVSGTGTDSGEGAAFYMPLPAKIKEW
jgi:type II secretory pathway pseudopilin PulG